MIRNRHWLAAFAVGFAVLCQAAVAQAVADSKLTPAPADLSKYLPDDTGAMVRINFQQLQRSPLLKPFVAQLKEKMKEGKGQKELAALGFDPLKDLGTFTLAGPVTKDLGKFLVILTGKFDVDKFQAALKEAAKKSGDDVLKVTKNGNFQVWEANPPNPKPPFPSTYYMAMVDANTILVTGGKSTLQDALDKATGKKKTKLDKEIAPLIAKTDPKESFSGLVTASALAKADFIPNGLQGKFNEENKKYRYLRLGVMAKEDIKIKFTFGTKDADIAKEIADQVDQVKFLAPLMLGMVASDPQKAKQLKPAMDAAKEVINTLESSTKGSTVRVEFTISKKLVEKIKEQAMKAKENGGKKKDPDDE